MVTAKVCPHLDPIMTVIDGSSSFFKGRKFGRGGGGNRNGGGGNRMNPMAREQDRSRFNRNQNPGMNGRSRPNGYGDQNGSRYGNGAPRTQNEAPRERSRSRLGAKDFGNGRDYGRSAAPPAANGNGRPSRFDAPPPAVASSVRENGRFSRFSDNKPTAAPSSTDSNGWNPSNPGSYNSSNGTAASTHSRREGGSRFSAANGSNHLKPYSTSNQGGVPRPLMSLN